MQEGTPLRDHLDQLNTILLDFSNIEVKIEDEDATLILLVSLPPLYENFVQSFIVGKDTVSLEEVRSFLHSRELHHKAAGIGGAGTEAVGLIASGGKRSGNPGKKKSKLSGSKVLNLVISVTTVRSRDIGKISALKRRGSNINNRRNKQVLLLSQNSDSRSNEDIALVAE